MLTCTEYFHSTTSPFGSSAERNKACATIFGYFSLASTPQSLLEQLLNLFDAQAVGALALPPVALPMDDKPEPIPEVTTTPTALPTGTKLAG
eukprot:jgi/Psemu1/8806/gm1.8806_g